MEMTKALFLTESDIDLHHHLALADRLRKRLEILFLVKHVAFRPVLLERGYSPFLYSELLTSSILRSIDKWWRDQRTKDFQEISYKGYDLWHYVGFEQELILQKMFVDDFRWVTKKSKRIFKWPRKFFKTAVEPRRGLMLDKKGLSDLEDIYKHSAALIEGYSRLLAFLKVQGTFIWNGLFFPTRICAEVSKRLGLKVYFSEEAYFPKTMLIDEEGVNAASSLYSEKWWNRIAQEELDEYKLNELNRFLNNFHSRGLSRVECGEKLNRSEVYSQIGIPLDKKIVFYPAQVEFDTNTILFSPNYKGNKDVIEEIAPIVSNYPQYHLVVKIHPRDEAKADEFRSILGDSGTVIGRMNIHSLLQASDIIAVINSTVGLEALTYEKPVIVLGKAIYSGKGFTFDVSSRDALSEVFERAVRKPLLSDEMKSLLQKFLSYLINNYLYYIEDNRFTSSKNVAIEERIFSELQGVKNKGYATRAI